MPRCFAIAIKNLLKRVKRGISLTNTAIFFQTEQEFNELKSAHSKTLSDYEDVQKQCSLLKTRCHQLENERLPLMAQLEFADRNLRQIKKQQQQQSAMTTSTTVHHQPPSSNPVLQSIENNNKSVSRLIRSPSLDMRVMRRTSKIHILLIIINIFLYI